MSLGDFFAIVEDMDTIRDSHNDAHIMLDQQDRPDVLADEFFEQLHQGSRFTGTHTGGRFVEQQ